MNDTRWEPGKTAFEAEMPRRRTIHGRPITWENCELETKLEYALFEGKIVRAFLDEAWRRAKKDYRNGGFHIPMSMLIPETIKRLESEYERAGK